MESANGLLCAALQARGGGEQCELTSLRPGASEPKDGTCQVTKRMARVKGNNRQGTGGQVGRLEVGPRDLIGMWRMCVVSGEEMHDASEICMALFQHQQASVYLPILLHGLSTARWSRSCLATSSVCTVDA